MSIRPIPGPLPQKHSTSVTCRGNRACLVLNRMSLRCLLFSSHKDAVEPICQVLAEIGIEAEYCESAVDAVEKVTTQQFQIVITDWSDQPEASFLLKTARDLKAAHRPLTLAFVSEADRPAALQAGANSVLLKPIRVEQVRDTMRTACDLLRAKQQPASPQTPRPIASAPQAQPEIALSASAAASAASAPSIPAPLPSSVGQMPEAGFRPGEFLSPGATGPGSQIDTEKEPEAPVSPDQSATDEVNALAELEPTAAAVPERPDSPEASDEEPAKKVSGWAELQARLNAGTRPPTETTKNELMSYSEMPADAKNPPESETPKVESSTETVESPAEEIAPESANALPEEHLSSGDEPPVAAKPLQTKRTKNLIVGAVAACLLVAVALPRTRLELIQSGRGALKAVQAWLNPPPPQVPQAVAQHETFGQAGDEYNLPAATPIPDATTDPSQIRVVPVVDPTAKPDKNAEANSVQSQTTAAENPPQDQNQAAPTQNQNPSDTSADQIAAAKPADVAPPSTAPGSTSSSVQPAVVQPALAQPAPVQPAAVQPVAPANAAVPPPAKPSPAVTAPLRTVSASTPVGIPSSLQTQLAPNAPVAGGAMPPEAAMSAIEPVKLAQTAVLDLLVQHVDPEYPAAAKSSGQSGTVTLQVLIGHDGTVQDAKFLQGSLMFARPALDAVKQWRFKPYIMNGGVVSVQSTITLNFRP